MLIFNRVANLELQPFKWAGSNVEPWTWNIPTSLVCCMHSIIFLFSQPDEDGSPWDPLDKYSSLQLRVTHRPSCLERICYLSALPPVHPGLKQSFGGCCIPVECQIALLNWAFLKLSGDRPVRDETIAPKGQNVRREHVILLQWIFLF